jgi:hypothetical protein
MNEFDKAEAAHIREGENMRQREEDAANLKDEWIANWLETAEVDSDIIWFALSEQEITNAMVLCYKTKDVSMLGYHVAKMIEAHMETLAAFAYDERMT